LILVGRSNPPHLLFYNLYHAKHYVFYGISIPDNLLHSSCARWTDFVAREAERRGFAWAYWEFCSGFGVYNKDLGRWNKPILNALMP
jgi:hypothetical protein